MTTLFNLQKLYKRLLMTSFFSRGLLAILVGIIAKIVTVPVFFLYYFITLKPTSLTAHDLSIIYANGFSSSNGFVENAISILILAPILENLIFPLVFWLFSTLKIKTLFSIIVITFISYHYHQSGTQQITGAIFFFCYSIFYAETIQVCGKIESYILTVIAHFITNLIAFLFMLQSLM